MPGPLAGFRIVDLSTMISGPVATMILADQGADVIKVEAPGGGDLTRQLGPRRNGMTAIFTTTNRNKRSLVLDLKQPRGIEMLERLVAGADVFVQNFRPGAVERMGIGEAALRRVKPDLVYVSISGFGEQGPYAQKRVYDPVIQALSGLAAIQADRDSGRPKMVRVIVPDKLTAVTAAQAISAALLARERSGQGQHVRLSMLDAMVSFLWPEGMVTHTLVGGEVAHGRPGSTADLVYETADGFITVATMSDAEWQGLARVAGHPEWLEDERFNTPAGRVSNSDVRLEVVGEVMRRRTSAEWLERLDAEQVPCAPILSRSDLLTDVQLAANELIVESEHPRAGRVRQTRPAARFDRTPAEIRSPAPSLGEHTDEVLGEIGLDSDGIAALRAAGTVA
jgi:crotonobetainyl-CoA:carnitine CoA-transferase CaiB-like acyl-CoA transferase